MKTFFKSILAVAVCASLFAACSKDDTVSDPSNGRKVTMTVTASSELESASGSRTTYDPLTGKISWNATGEYLQVLETAASTTVFATSQEGTVSDNTAKFAVTFPANENTPLVYNAVYPASAWVTSSNTDITNMKVITPTVQQPTATSFDSNADLLIAKSISQQSQPTELEMSFGRAVAIGKMTVKNLASEEPVLGVEFTAPDKKVTGRSYVDMTAGTVKEYGYATNFADNVTLNYSSEMNITANSETGMTAYFTCFPFEVAAGETFTVTVTTATKIFTKTVTVQEGRALAFTTGDSSTFAVDMTGATEEENETLSGNYVITATQSEVTYAMSSLADGSRLAPVVITPSNPYKTGDETLIWTITKSGDNYTISQGENYLSWESGNSATTSATPYELVITKDKSEGTYQIASVATPSRILAKNTTAALGFGFYEGTQTKNLTLIPAEYVAYPKVTLEKNTLELAFDDETTHSIVTTLKNAEAKDVTINVYEGTTGTTSATWLTAKFTTGTNNTLDVSAEKSALTEPRTARVIISVTTTLGTSDAILTVTQNPQPVAGEKVLTFDFSKSPISGWPTSSNKKAGDYIFTLAEVDYTFSLTSNVYCNSGYLMVNKNNSLGLPALAGYKLTKVVGTLNGNGSPSLKSVTSITSDATGNTVVTGGEAQTWSTKGGNYTYTLSNTAVNTKYYMYVSSAANSQYTNVELTYVPE